MWIRRGLRVLFDPDATGGGGTTTTGGASDLAVAEYRALKVKYDELKKERDDLFVKQTQLEKDHAKLTADHDTAIKQLGTFTSEKARKEHLATVLTQKDFKGVTVDTDKVMKYLSRGDFDEKNLDTEVREAIGLFGEKAKAPENTINARGAGTETSASTRTENTNGDFIGAFALRSMGKA